jgi:hypothetical protein
VAVTKFYYVVTTRISTYSPFMKSTFLLTFSRRFSQAGRMIIALTSIIL